MFYGVFNINLQYAYYLIKPMLPRFVQIALRRRLSKYRLSRAGDVWPVLESAARLPEDWAGWPENKRFAFILIYDIKTVALRVFLKLKAWHGYCPRLC